jgi:hypothetical protein
LLAVSTISARLTRASFSLPVFEPTIHATALMWARKSDAIAAEAALDGLYVIRTSLGQDQLDAAATVAAYKSLAHVERAFRFIRRSICMGVRCSTTHEARARPGLRVHAGLLRGLAQARVLEAHAVR